MTSEELSYKVNPLRRTEVRAKNLFSFHSEDGGKVCSGLADLSCVFLNRARGNMRQGPCYLGKDTEASKWLGGYTDCYSGLKPSLELSHRK